MITPFGIELEVDVGFAGVDTAVDATGAEAGVDVGGGVSCDRLIVSTSIYRRGVSEPTGGTFSRREGSGTPLNEEKESLPPALGTFFPPEATPPSIIDASCCSSASVSKSESKLFKISSSLLLPLLWAKRRPRVAVGASFSDIFWVSASKSSMCRTI
jgi:hypothetical protein